MLLFRTVSRVWLTDRRDCIRRPLTNLFGVMVKRSNTAEAGSAIVQQTCTIVCYIMPARAPRSAATLRKAFGLVATMATRGRCNCGAGPLTFIGNAPKQIMYCGWSSYLWDSCRQLMRTHPCSSPSSLSLFSIFYFIFCTCFLLGSFWRFPSSFLLLSVWPHI